MSHPDEVHAQDEEPFAHGYGLLGITVPLLPQSFARAHEIGFGGMAGVMLRAPYSTAVFAEAEYGYTPISFLGIVVDYGNLHQTTLRGGVRYFFGEETGPQPFVTGGAGVSYSYFGPAEDMENDRVDPPDDAQFPDRSNHWHPVVTAGGGTVLNVQPGFSIKSEVQIHVSLMDHGAMLSATPRIGAIYNW